MGSRPRANLMPIRARSFDEEVEISSRPEICRSTSSVGLVTCSSTSTGFAFGTGMLIEISVFTKPEGRNSSRRPRREISPSTLSRLRFVPRLSAALKRTRQSGSVTAAVQRRTTSLG